MRVLGMISGTSHDGIDCSVVDFSARDNLLHARIEYSSTTPYSSELRERLASALPPASATLKELCELDTLIGQEFATAARDAAVQGGAVDVICSHGQTVFHWVDETVTRGTLQVGQPAWIAELVGLPVVSDLRVRDVAAHGQGAPLVSIMDFMLFSRETVICAAVNLGGISNLTIAGSNIDPIAYDVGPANALIDAAVKITAANSRGYDVNGDIAASGSVDELLLEQLMQEPYYRLLAPKSTGKELFNESYLRQILAGRTEHLATANLLATLTELTVRTVADELRRTGARKVVVSGGGSHNRVIMSGLASAVPDADVLTSAAYGIPVDSKEAIAFALIGWLTMHGLPGALASCTGADGERVLGTITPGRGPLRLPEPLIARPSALVVSEQDGE